MLVYYMMLFLAPFMEYPYLPQIGTFTVIKAIGVLAMMVAVIRAGGLNRPLYLFRWAESKLFLFLLLMITFSMVWVGFTPQAANILQTYAAFLIFLFTTLVMVDTVEKVRTSCLVMSASMFLASLWIYNGYFRHHEARPGGVVGDPNYYALIAISVLPMTILFQSTTKGVMRLFMVGTALSLVASTLLGGSRAGFLGLCLSAAYLIRYMRHRTLLIVGGIVTVGLLLVVLPSGPLNRLLHPTREATTSADIRSELVSVAIKLILEHPLTGVGVGEFKGVSALYLRNPADAHIAHNTYLNLGAELGIFGVLTYVAILFMAWRRSRKMAAWASRQNPPETIVVLAARSIEAGLIGFAFAATFLTADYIKHAWILVFMGLALNRIMLLQTPARPVGGVPAGARTGRPANVVPSPVRYSGGIRPALPPVATNTTNDLR